MLHYAAFQFFRFGFVTYHECLFTDAVLYLPLYYFAYSTLV